MTDILIIGAGLSGLMTAYTAAKAGQKTHVIAKGLGALHWTAGTVDLFGYPPGARTAPIRRPLDYIADTLTKEQPESPYALLGADRIAAALDAFQALAAEIGLAYYGAATPGDNLLLPTAAGAARPTYLAPAAQIGGDLARKDPMLIVGFDGLSDFYPRLVADNLARQGQPARAAVLPMALLTDRIDSNTLQQAAGMDDAQRRAKLIGALQQIVKPGERIGLPPILGLQQHATAFQEVQAQMGATVFEIPLLPPSVPGTRLFTALREHLRAMGVSVDAGMEVINAHSTPGAGSTPGHVAWVESATSTPRPYRHTAQRFVLATGGILGAGFNSDQHGRLWEVVFNLPLSVPQQRSQWFRPAFFNPEGHPVFAGGVRVNRALQPVDEAGGLLYENLWVVGDALANDDSILQRSLEGTAIATGVVAGQALALAWEGSLHAH